MTLSELKPCTNCGGSLGPIFHVMRLSMAIIKPDRVTIIGDEKPELMTELFFCLDCFCCAYVNLARLEEKCLAEKESADALLSDCCQAPLRMHFPCDERAACSTCGKCIMCGERLPLEPTQEEMQKELKKKK